jgi:hypothetical protein
MIWSRKDLGIRYWLALLKLAHNLIAHSQKPWSLDQQNVPLPDMPMRAQTSRCPRGAFLPSNDFEIESGQRTEASMREECVSVSLREITLSVTFCPSDIGPHLLLSR